MHAGERTTLNDSAGKRSETSGSPRRLGRIVLTALMLAFSLLVIGFFWFIERVPQGDPALPAKADGIVVLTGRASRISDAIELLASKHGDRLLITGVYPTT